MCDIVDTIIAKHTEYDFTKNCSLFEKYGKHRGKFNKNLLSSLGNFFGIDDNELSSIGMNSYEGLVSVDKMEYGLCRLCVSSNDLLSKLDEANIEYHLIHSYTNVYSVGVNHYNGLLRIYGIV